MNASDLDRLRRWAHLLDSAFRIPGTRIRFGLDPILGLVPGAGDFISPVFGVVLLAHAIYLRVPRIVQLRMLLHVAIDALVGAIPVLGDALDLFWRANDRNLALLERHASSSRRPTRGDWIFVCVVLGLAALCAVLPIVLLVWITAKIGIF